MNKKFFGRILAWALTLAVLLTSGAIVTVNPASAAVKNVTKVTVTKKAVASTLLRENVKLTKALLKKIVKVGYTAKVGKTTKTVTNYTGFSSPQIGKKVTVNKAGKMKITVKAFGKKANISLKVNKMTGIEISKCYLTLIEGEKFSKTAFKGSSKVVAFYQKGATKEITSYTVTPSAPVVKADKDGYFRVTVSRNGFSDTIAVKVVKPGQQPTTEPSVEPSQVPTEEPSVSPSASPSGTPSASAKPSQTPSVSPSVTPSAKPSQTPGSNGGGDIIIINPTPNCPTCKPSAKPSASPSAEPTVTPSTAPTPIPNQKFTLTVSKKGQGTVNLNDKALAFVNDTVELTNLDAGRCKFEAVPADGYKFDSWYDEDAHKTIGSNATLTLNIASDRKISAIFAEISGTVNVTYKHEDGTVLISQSVSFGETLKAPTSNVYRIDKDFDGWMFDGTLYRGEIEASEFYSDAGVKLSDAIKASTTLHKDVTIFPAYTDKTVKYYNVSITNGTLTQPAEFAGLSTATVPAGTHIFAETEVPAGQNVVWQNASGVTVGNGMRYDCTVNSDIDVTAVLTTEEAEPTCYFNSQPTVDTVNCRFSYNISCRIPATYQKDEWGVIVSPIRSSADELVLGGENVMSLPDDVAETMNDNNADLRYTWTAPPRIIESYNVMYFRVYVVTDKGTIYSDIQSVVW